MRHPSEPNNNNQPQRPRARGAIRTHLGRKRSGPRNRAPNGTLAHLQPAGEAQRFEQEHLFDRLLGQFQTLFGTAGEKTAAALDAALDAACDTLVAAGEFSVENAGRLRQFLHRDLLHRDHPALTFRTGDITTAGNFACEGCGWALRTTRTSVLPPCPQCSEATFRKTG